MDFIMNGQANGDVASRLMQNNMDPNCLRPFIEEDGRNYVTVMNKGKPEVHPVANANASLRKDDWIAIDRAIVRAAKPRLRFVNDLRSAGLQYTITNGMGKTSLETESQSDIDEADISMDGVRESTSDRPQFSLDNLPLPIIHKDFNFNIRQVMASRNGGSPLDTTTAELAARRVAESAEKLALGSTSFSSYAGGTVYGLTNFPSRNTKDITDPTTSAWTPKKTLQEVLSMRQQSQADNYFGPWNLYVSTNWDEYLDDDYSDQKGDNTLRQRIAMIEGINAVRTLDYLTGYQMVLVQMTSEVIREVVGMDITTVQWETKGGMQLNFKVMAIMVPQLRADYSGNAGIVHGDVA